MTVPHINIDVKTRADGSSKDCVFSTAILKYDVSILEQIVSENTKYVVKWNYDLKNSTLRLPRNCILEFDGGRIANGKIVWNDTKVMNLYRYTILENVVEEGTRTTYGGEI